MKVCFFGDATSVHLQRMIPGLVDRGVEVHIVSHKSAEIRGATVERFSVPPLSLAYPRRWRSRWNRYLQSFVDRFDVVTIHFLHDWGFTPELMRQGCFIVTPWGSDLVPPPGEQEPPPELMATRRMMLQEATAVTACGPSFAARVADYADIEVAGIDLMPLGVDLSLFDPRLRDGRSDDDIYRVGFFKGFRPVYGSTYLMRALPTVLDALPTTRFCLVGDGPQLSECKRLAALYGVEAQVQWVKRQPHRNIPNYLAGWDLSVIPSLCESFGVAALESSAMHVPVVSTDVGGLPDTVVDGETGVLVPSRAPEQLADAIIRLLRDEPRRRRMGEVGRELVERHYNWDVILDEWVRAFERAVDRVAIMV